MLRLIAVLIVPIVWLLSQARDDAGAGSGGGSAGGSGAGDKGSAGGAGSAGSGSGSGGQGSGGSSEGSGAGSATGGAAAGSGFEGEFNPEQARALIDKLRPFESEALQLRQQLQQAQSSLQEYEQQNQTELEQAQNKLAQAEADKLKLQQEVRELKARVLGGELGIVDTQAAALLLKWDELGEEPDDEKVKAALEQMVKDRPWLKGATQQQRQQQTQQNKNGGSGDSGVTSTNQSRTNQGKEQPKHQMGLGRIKAAINAASKGSGS